MPPISKSTNKENAPPSSYTPEELYNLRENLPKSLGPEFLATRQGPSGSKLTYIEGHTSFDLANRLFGFNGWSSSVMDVTVDFVDIDNGKVSLGVSVVIRVTLKDGSYHEDIGYGAMENAKTKAMAFEKAKKEATTDAYKRVLRIFGNALGNCIYDKKYCKDITKVTAHPKLFQTEALYRDPQFATPQQSFAQQAQQSFTQQAFTRSSSSSGLPNTTVKATASLNGNSVESGVNRTTLKSDTSDEFEDEDDAAFSRLADVIESDRAIFFDEGPKLDEVTPALRGGANVPISTRHNSLSEGPSNQIPAMPPPGSVPKTFAPITNQDPKTIGIPPTPKFGTAQNRQFVPQLPAKGNNDIGVANAPPAQSSKINIGNAPPVVNQPYANNRPLNPQAATANHQQNYNSNRPMPGPLNKSTTGGGGAVLNSGGLNGGSGVSLARQSSSVGGPASLAGPPAPMPPSGAGRGDGTVNKGTKRPSSMDNIGMGMNAASPGGGADPWFPSSAVETMNTGVGLGSSDGSTGAIKRAKQG